MRTTRFCFVLLAAGVLAAACASEAASTPFDNGAGYGQVATNGPGLPGSTAAGHGTVAPGMTAAPGSQSGGARASGAGPAGTSGIAAPEDQIVKTGTIGIQVAAIDASIMQATDQIHALGGWLAGSDRTTSTAEDMASVTFRVPVNQFENALAAMRKLGSKVLSEHTESTPVGGQIVDLQARIANLRASEKAIQAIMDKSTTIGDVLSVQQRIADVQGQIEELSGQLAGLTDQSTYSTLTVEFVVPAVLPSYTPQPTDSPSPTPIPWSARDQADKAAGALGQVGEATTTALIWLVILIILLVVICVCVVGAVAIDVTQSWCSLFGWLFNMFSPGLCQ